MASKWAKSTSQKSKSTGIWLVDHRQVRALLLAKTAASHCFLQLNGFFVKHLQWFCSPKLLKSFPRFEDLNNFRVHSQDSNFEASNNIQGFCLLDWSLKKQWDKWTILTYFPFKEIFEALCSVNLQCYTCKDQVDTAESLYYYFEQYSICVPYKH